MSTRGSMPPTEVRVDMRMGRTRLRTLSTTDSSGSMPSAFMKLRALDDEDGVVHHHPGEDDESEDGEDVEVLLGHVAVDLAPVVDEGQSHETPEGGQRDTEHDHQRV